MTANATLQKEKKIKYETRSTGLARDVGLKGSKLPYVSVA